MDKKLLGRQINLCRELKVSPSYLLVEVLPDSEIRDMDALLELWRTATPTQMKIISSMVKSALENFKD